MNRFHSLSLARLPLSYWRRLLALSVLMLVGGVAQQRTAFASTAQDEPLFGPPPVAELRDEVLLLSTRKVGTVCDSAAVARGLICERLLSGPAEEGRWTSDEWQKLTTTQASMPTIIYIHGNRVPTGQDKAEGLLVYRSFRRHCPHQGPIRFVIWSWPSSQIRGPIKDYLVKAQRTNPVAWQLAWLLDQMPKQTPIAMIGYSYGTRVICGATHLLVGGQLGALQLPERVNTSRLPIRVALMAAAFDADWMQPGKLYDRSLKLTEHAVIGTNQLDPAMRFYHLSNGRGRMDALGKRGVFRSGALGPAARRLNQIDFTHEVGRSHVVGDYFAAQAKIKQVWRELLWRQPPKGTTIAYSASVSSVGVDR